MKKVPRPPALEWRVVNLGSHSFSDGRSRPELVIGLDFLPAPRTLSFQPYTAPAPLRTARHFPPEVSLANGDSSC